MTHRDMYLLLPNLNVLHIVTDLFRCFKIRQFRSELGLDLIILLFPYLDIKIDMNSV